MDNKNLVVTENQSFFSRIKNWFKGVFGKKNSTKNEDINSILEFDKQDNIVEPEIVEQQNAQQIKYEFSTPTVSKQKLGKTMNDLDKGNIGVEELYQLSDDELKELTNMYDGKINDTVTKLNEVQSKIVGLERKIAKMKSIEAIEENCK